MAGVADDDVRGGKGGDVGGFVDGSLEGVEALAVLGGDSQGSFGTVTQGAEIGNAEVRMKVGLVPDGEEGAA